MRERLAREAARLEEDVLYTSKSHYAAADRWRSVHLWIGVPTAVLTGLAGAVIVGGPDEVRGVPLDLVFGLVAIAGAVATAVMTFLGPEKRSTAHHAAGDGYNAIRGRARRFRELDALKPLDDGELSDRLDAMVKERDDLNRSSPLVPTRAFEKARKNIEEGQADYRADG